MREGWTYKKLGECLSYIKNGANIKQTKGAAGIPITRIETLSGGVFNRDRLGYADIFSTENYIQYIMDDGDILMSHINSKAYIGRSVLYKKNGDEVIIHGMNLLRLKVIPTIIIPTYINTYFKSNKFKDNVARIRKDAVNQSSMAITDLKRIPIPVPPLAEQERIVAELDLLQGIIEKKKEQLKAYDQLAQSIFYTMFGDPIDNPKGWETKKLGQVYKLKSGDGLSAKQFIEGQYPVYGGNGISGYHNSFNMDGDYIIIGRVGAYCGNVRYVSGKFWLTDNAFQLIYDEKEQHPVFIKHLLTVLDLHQYANHAAQPVISNITLKEVKVLFPPLSLQQEFAEKVEAIERQKALVQQSIDETQTMFDYTMDKYFG